jgi:hypothetical protein
VTGGEWSDGKYVVDVHHTVTITSNTFNGHGAGTYGEAMYLAVGPPGLGQLVAFVSHNAAQEPEADRLTMTIPPCTLVSRQQYDARGAFRAFADATGVASAFHELDTAFGIVAVGGSCVTFDMVADAVTALGIGGGNRQALLTSLRAARIRHRAAPRWQGEPRASD